MNDTFETARENFAKEIGEKIPPRDQQGKFIAETTKPERIFALREVESDESGEDGGEDPRLSAREREIADGRLDERAEWAERQSRKELRRADENEGLPEELSEDDLETAEEPAEDAEKYEIIVEGERREVTLQEALQGYVRQETYAKYVQGLQDFKTKLEGYDAQLRANWALWDKAKAEFEEDVANMMPVEPNWDQEFAKDPVAAHNQQKVFQAIYARLANSRAKRAERQQIEAQERDRQVERYAVDGFAKFVADNRDKISDDQTLQKELQSMRRTGHDLGFSEYEIATIYDPRMLTALWWASRFRRMTANRPKAVIPGKGKTVTPGSAAPLGKVRRNGFDEAQRQLARTGRIDDAAEVFRRILT